MRFNIEDDTTEESEDTNPGTMSILTSGDVQPEYHLTITGVAVTVAGSLLALIFGGVAFLVFARRRKEEGNEMIPLNWQPEHKFFYGNPEEIAAL